MRILFVIPAIGNVYGGPSKTVKDLAQALTHQGLSVDIVTTNANAPKSLDVPFKKWCAEPGYRIQYFSYISLRDYKWSNSFAKWIFRHVQDYDLVHSNAIFSLTNAPAHWACQWHNVPYIMTPHGMLEPWAFSYKTWKKRLYYSFFERPALNQVSVIQALASSEANNIRALKLKSPIVVVPNGIHDRDFQNRSDPKIFHQKFPHLYNKKLILFLGRIDPKKGLDILAKAFELVYPQFPEAHLVVAGPDNIGFLPKAQNFFLEAGCLSAVTFTGMLSGDLKYAALAAATIYVAPSYSEGFSMSILEGMATGLPCVITTGCNFPEAAEVGAAYVVEPTADDVSHALMRCLQDPEKAKSLGHRARQLVLENYTWDRVATNLIQVYQKIIKREVIPQRAILTSNH